MGSTRSPEADRSAATQRRRFPEIFGGTIGQLTQSIIAFIAGAKRSLDIAIQELDNPRIAQAILDARWREIDVDLFLEQTDAPGPN